MLGREGGGQAWRAPGPCHPQGSPGSSEGGGKGACSQTGDTPTSQLFGMVGVVRIPTPFPHRSLPAPLPWFLQLEQGPASNGTFPAPAAIWP